MSSGMTIAVGVGVSVLFLATFVLIVGVSLRRITQGQALIIHRGGMEPKVAFASSIVLPVVQRGEVLDLSVKTIKISCKDVRCADRSRIDLDLTMYVRVNKTPEDVLRVAQSVGCERASSQAGVEELFVPKFMEAVATVAAQMEPDELERKREQLKDQVIMVIGKDLNGFILDDATVDRIAPATLAGHDPDGRNRADADELTRLRAEVKRLEAEVARLSAPK